ARRAPAPSSASRRFPSCRVPSASCSWACRDRRKEELMARVEIGLNLLPVNSARQTAEWARLAEDVGFDFVGITDGQMIWRDVYVALTLAAAGTKRIRLGPWVTNPTT